MKRYPAILSAFYNTPQLVTPDKLCQIDAFLRRRIAGQEMEFEAEWGKPVCQLHAVDSGDVYVLDHGESGELVLEAMIGGDGQPVRLAANTVPATTAAPQQFVAVLPLFGTLFQHGSLEMDMSGGTSTDAWAQDFRRLGANPAVKTIVVECHSPGGQCYGTLEAADVVRAERDSGRTRVVSVANSMMASAAVWIGTAAKEVFVTPGGEIGSIGVVSLHWDYSKAYEELGIKPTLVATSRKKILGNEFEPLDAEALAQIEADNQAVYQQFLRAMAANRGVTPARVEADFGGGGMLWAKDAVKAGLADGVATMADVLAREVERLKGAGRKSVRNKLAIAQAKAA